MFKTIEKLNYSYAIILGILFYLLTIVVHILILTNIIPLQWINGGNSTSIDAQLPLSIFNLVISVIGLCFMAYATFYRGNNPAILISRLLSVLWLFGFLQQLLGSPFEKFIMSIILLIGLISHIRISLH